jgi:hypothetical protein
MPRKEHRGLAHGPRRSRQKLPVKVREAQQYPRATSARERGDIAEPANDLGNTPRRSRGSTWRRWEAGFAGVRSASSHSFTLRRTAMASSAVSKAPREITQSVSVQPFIKRIEKIERIAVSYRPTWSAGTATTPHKDRHPGRFQLFCTTEIPLCPPARSAKRPARLCCRPSATVAAELPGSLAAPPVARTPRC